MVKFGPVVPNRQNIRSIRSQITKNFILSFQIQNIRYSRSQITKNLILFSNGKWLAWSVHLCIAIRRSIQLQDKTSWEPGVAVSS